MTTLRRRSALEKSPVVPLIFLVLVISLVIVFVSHKKTAAIPIDTSQIVCQEIDTRLDEANNDWQIMSPIVVGNCYTIDENDRQALIDTISTNRLQTLIKKINSGDQHLSATQIEMAINESLETGVLNLIKN